MPLYTAHLPSLGGFYASDAYVAADHAEGADQGIIAAVNAWIAECIADFNYVPGIDPEPEDPSWAEAIGVFRKKVEVEIRANLQLHQSGVTLIIRV